ncbi:hypothetical protein FO519_009224 [Halicephalobus sp. NKZ332]|nr:hypothetical protein FO519_009224 [Halicephalobus sp. NKZ332]
MFNESERFWIGVDNILGDGWRNVDDGSNIIFDNWAQNEPSNDSNACVSVDKEGMWYNDNCSNNYPYICGVSDDEYTTTSLTLSTTATTNDLLTPCWSYIPFSVDISNALTPDQFSAKKNFITKHFLKELFPIDLQPAAAVPYGVGGGVYLDVQFNVSDMITVVEDLSQCIDCNSNLLAGIRSLTYTGVFDYKDGIPVNSVVFAGNVSYLGSASDLQYDIDFLTTNGSTVTIVFINPDLDLTSFQNLTNVSIVQWSDNSTKLLINIRKNMRCGGGEPVYRPCKRWFSLVPDYSDTLSEIDWGTQITFLWNEVGRMNRPDKIQFIGDHDDSYWVDWNTIWNIEEIQEHIGATLVKNSDFSLNTTLQTLSNAYYSKNRTEYQPPYTALVFIPTTESYENYGGAEEVAPNLKNLGFEFTFFLMGPGVDESKLTNYTTNFVYWRNMRNSYPENWEQVRLQAYGCQND